MIANEHGLPADQPESLESDLESRFNALYEAHFEFVWRSVRMMGMSPDAADDVVQDVFVVAHRRLNDFEARASARTWLYAIARRVVSGHRRSLRRRFRLLAKVSSADREPPAATPFDSTLASESKRNLLSALEALSEEQRTVFALAELEDMTVPEIATAIGVNVNTVYSRLRLARQNLAARLQMAKTEATT